MATKEFNYCSFPLKLKAEKVVFKEQIHDLPHWIVENEQILRTIMLNGNGNIVHGKKHHFSVPHGSRFRVWSFVDVSQLLIH